MSFADELRQIATAESAVKSAPTTLDAPPRNCLIVVAPDCQACKGMMRHAAICGDCGKTFGLSLSAKEGA